MAELSAPITAAVLAGAAALHLAWGAGSTFPFDSPADLADAVVGTPAGVAPPPPAACVAVAVARLGGAGLVVGAPGLPRGLRRAGLVAMTGALAARGALGLAGQTDFVSSCSTSSRFRRNDRWVYAPLCLALAAGSYRALRAL